MLSEPWDLESPRSLARWNLDTATAGALQDQPPADIRALIGSGDDLPTLPESTRRLLELRADPNATAVDLATVVESDPLLASQLLRWANSAYYALREPTTSVRDAIVRALGFHTALSLASALSALSPLKTPNDGPIGRDRLWRHGLQCAALMQALSSHLPSDKRPPSGLVQLAGLTQNIGYLVLGHLLPEPFRLLSRLIAANPGLDLEVIDRFAIGVEHTRIGGWLFETWGMPAPLHAAVLHHHNPAYQGDDEVLVCLTSLADRLLEVQQGPRESEPDQAQQVEGLLDRLGLSRPDCDAAMLKIRERSAQDE